MRGTAGAKCSADRSPKSDVAKRGRARDAANRGITDERYHVVAVAAERQGPDIFDRDAGFLGQKTRKAGAIEHAGHADDLVRRQPCKLLSTKQRG